MLVMFNPFSTFSGSEIFAANLARSFRNQGCELHIVCKSTGGYKSAIVEPGITLTEYPAAENHYFDVLNDYRKRLQICKLLLKTNQFDIVLAVGAGQGLIFRDLARTIPCPPLVYYTFDCMRHEGDEILKVLMLKKASTFKKARTIVRYSQLSFSDRFSCKYSDLILASSLDTKRGLHSYYGAPLEKIKVTFAGVPNDYAENFVTDKTFEPVFLHVATDYERKGTIYLLKALLILKRNYNFYPKVLIVGKTNPTYVNMANHFKVNTVFVDTQLSKHREIYASCTALVAPSVSEGFCLPVIEAAMFSKPAIVSDAGSLPELVNDGVDGFVVPVGDVTSLAQRIYTLATDEKTLKQMSLKAKEKSQRFEINNIAKNNLSIIQSLANIKAGSFCSNVSK